MMQKKGLNKYQDFWQWSVTNKEDFWSETVENLNIQFTKKYTSIVDTSKGVEYAEWLKNAKLNIVDSCFQNDDDAIAVIFQDKKKQLQKVSQKQLLELVNKIANSFTSLGLTNGDRIAIYMPMTLEAVAIYLAGIKAGIEIVTIADSFSPNEIAIRLNITKPKIIFTQDVNYRAGKEIALYKKVVEANAPKTIVFKSSNQTISLRNEDILWDAFLSSNTNFNSVPKNPDDMITILFSSGTTGEPKAIPWTHVTPIKSASDGYYHQDIHKNDVVCWPTNLGWMMGPWLVFATLINKATIALYYDMPTGDGFGEFVQNAKVTMLGVIPSFVKYWKASKNMEKYDWNAIKCFSSTGEVSNAEDMSYLMQLANNKPVIEYCGGTEIGGGYVTSTVVQPNIASTFSTQALGGEFILLNDKHNKCTKGELFLFPPIMGLSNSLLTRNNYNVYYRDVLPFEGRVLRRHGDELELLSNGYYIARGRVDDAMNLGGIKISSVQIEGVLNSLDFIKESAAIAVSPENGGPSLLVIFYSENESRLLENERLQQAINCVKEKINPLFRVHDLVKLEELPRTASNKILRRSLRDIYESK
ncbi:AMP-binding protein [Lutibacter sp.]|uniref:AMP-binding protein n=1 Tax=Lutibacter sp. TaxID=1925666 RepID=UPI003563E2EB